MMMDARARPRPHVFVVLLLLFLPLITCVPPQNPPRDMIYTWSPYRDTYDQWMTRYSYLNWTSLDIIVNNTLVDDSPFTKVDLHFTVGYVGHSCGIT